MNKKLYKVKKKETKLNIEKRIAKHNTLQECLLIFSLQIFKTLITEHVNSKKLTLY